MGREVGLGNEIRWPKLHLQQRPQSFSWGVGIAIDIQNIPVIGHIILGLHCCQTNIDEDVRIVNTK